MKNKVLFVCGRTGGPMLPFEAIIKNTKCEAVMVGVKNSFEVRYCKDNNYPLYFLPEVKLKLLSFKGTDFGETVSNVVDFFKSSILFVFSVFRSIYLLLKIKPDVIYSTGSFLAVPLVFGSKFVFWQRCKIILHQQDPLMGLSNKICRQFADLKTCSFAYTANKYSDFELIDNPFVFEQKPILETQLRDFMNNSAKPIFMIFGGGSGSEVINNWVIRSQDKLLQNYKILHLTGIFQVKDLPQIQNSDYLRREILTSDMHSCLQKADLVLCRAGLGSITELNYLQKPTFLVPIPDSHQGLNAQLCSQFVSLDQNNLDSWLEIIVNPPKTTPFILPNNARQTKYYERFSNLITQS